MFTRVDDVTALDGAVVRYQAKCEHGLGEISASRNAIMIQGIVLIKEQEEVKEIQTLLLKCIAHKKFLGLNRFNPNAEPLTEIEVEKAVSELRARVAEARAAAPSGTIGTDSAEKKPEAPPTEEKL